MINEMEPAIQAPKSAHLPRPESHVLPSSSRSLSANPGAPQQPVIDVSESDGHFNVYADFRPVLESSAGQVVVEFAQQGIILTGGTEQRYLPIPTDALILHAQVAVTDGIARISIPTADAGHRWRSIVMW